MSSTTPINPLHPKILPGDVPGIMQDEIELVELYLAQNKDKKIIKLNRKETYNVTDKNGQQKSFKLSRSVMIDESGNQYALYKGKNQALGAGSYGRVKLAVQLNGSNKGELVAVKVQKMGTGQFSDKKAFRREAQMDIKKGVGLGIAYREDKAKGYVFMKLGKKNVWDTPGKNFKEREAMGISAFMKLDKLHSKDIIHRDLKGGNMLWDPDKQEMTLIDLGFHINLKKAKKFKGKGTVPGINLRKDSDGKLVTTNGEVYYHSKRFNWNVDYKYWPAEARSSKQGNWFSKMSDVYGMGVVLRDDIKILSYDNTVPGEIYYETRKLIEQMLDDDPSKRPSTKESLQRLLALKKKREDLESGPKHILDADIKKLDFTQSNQLHIDALVKVWSDKDCDDNAKKDMWLKLVWSRNWVAIEELIDKDLIPKSLAGELVGTMPESFRNDMFKLGVKKTAQFLFKNNAILEPDYIAKNYNGVIVQDYLNNVLELYSTKDSLTLFNHCAQHADSANFKNLVDRLGNKNIKNLMGAMGKNDLPNLLIAINTVPNFLPDYFPMMVGHIRTLDPALLKPFYEDKTVKDFMQEQSKAFKPMLIDRKANLKAVPNKPPDFNANKTSGPS